MSQVFPENAAGPEREGLAVEIDGRRYVVNTEGIGWRTIAPTRPGSDQGTGASASTLTNEVVWSRWRNNWIHGEGQEYADRTQGEEESDEWRYLTQTDIDTTEDNKIQLADRPLSLAATHGWNGARTLESTGPGSILAVATTDGVWGYATTIRPPDTLSTSALRWDSTADSSDIDFRWQVGSIRLVLTDPGGTTRTFTSTVSVAGTGWVRIGFVYFVAAGPTPTVRFFEQAKAAGNTDWTGTWTQLGADVTGTAWTPGAFETMVISNARATAEMAFGFDAITSAADFNKRTSPTRFFETNWSTSDGWLGETSNIKNLTSGATGQITDLRILTNLSGSRTAEEAFPDPSDLRPRGRGKIGGIQAVVGLPMEIPNNPLPGNDVVVHDYSMFVYVPGDETIRLATTDDTPALELVELASFILGAEIRDIASTSTGLVFTIEGQARKTIGFLDPGHRDGPITPPLDSSYDPSLYVAADQMSFIAGVGARVVFGEGGKLQELNTAGTATLIVDRGADFTWSGALAVGTGVIVWGTHGDYSEIFTMTTSELDGTFQAPEPAAKMQFGEEVTRMIDVAGVLVIGTTSGLRLGLINADQSVTYGPVNDKIGGVYELVAAGTDEVYAVTTETPTLWRFDLTNFIDELVPAFYRASITPRDDVYVNGASGWSAEPFWSVAPLLHDNREVDDVADKYETRLVAIGRGRLMVYAPHEAEDQVAGGVRAIDGNIDLGLFTFDVGEPVILDTVRVDWEVNGSTFDTTSVRVVVENLAGDVLIDQTQLDDFSTAKTFTAEYGGALDTKGLRVKVFLHGDQANNAWPEVTSITLRAVPVPFMSEELELPIILRPTVQSEWNQDVDFDVWAEWGFLREICRLRKRFRLKVGSYETWARLESIQVERGALGGGNGLDGFTGSPVNEFLKGEWVCRFATQTPDLIGGFTGGLGGEEIWENASALAYFDANSEEYGLNAVTNAGTWFDRTTHHRHATAAGNAPTLDVAHLPDSVSSASGQGLVSVGALPPSDYTVSFIVDWPAVQGIGGQYTAIAGRDESVGVGPRLLWFVKNNGDGTFDVAVSHEDGVTRDAGKSLSPGPHGVTVRYDSTAGQVFFTVNGDAETAGQAINASAVTGADLELFEVANTDPDFAGHLSTFGVWTDSTAIWASGVHSIIIDEGLGLFGEGLFGDGLFGGAGLG